MTTLNDIQPERIRYMSTNLAFRGVIPPVVTPDTKDHQLDVVSFERSVNRMIDAGVDGLFFLGSSGEVVFATDERRDQIVREAVRIVAGRVPVLVALLTRRPSACSSMDTVHLRREPTRLWQRHRFTLWVESPR